ncbi:MAG: ACT domain-containing protein, partial [Gammaproteobacteria bacterium]|nr:ACT domain-containing protein [Gammaproteobacteria bacterium]
AIELVRKAFARELEEGQIQSVEADRELAILAVVGDGMAGMPGVAAKVFEALGSAAVNVRAIAQGASERNISVVVPAKAATRALRAVHASFYLSATTLSVGIIGPGTVGRVLLEQIASQSARLQRDFRGARIVHRLDRDTSGVIVLARDAETHRSLSMAFEARGVDIDCDAYPYTAGSNPLKNILPQWVQAGGVDAMIERLALPQTRQRIRDEVAADGLNNWGKIESWACVQISITPNTPQHAGKTIADIASERGLDPVDALCDYLREDKGATRVLVTSISENDVRDLMCSPSALIGSDGNCVADYGTVSQGMPHPRFYGTFPRVLGHYSRKEGLMPLELAIYKMTGGTARALKLHDRGLLRVGYRADMALFDPADFIDQSTYAKPHQYPSGSRTTVLVNG